MPIHVDFWFMLHGTECKVGSSCNDEVTLPVADGIAGLPKLRNWHSEGLV